MAQVGKNCRVEASAHVTGNARIFDGVIVKGNAIVSGNVKLYQSVQVADDAKLSGSVRASNTAMFHADVLVDGVGNFQGEADISSKSDWIVVIKSGKVVTIHKSRAAAGYELNVDGIDLTLQSLAHTLGDPLADFLASLVDERGWAMANGKAAVPTKTR